MKGESIRQVVGFDRLNRQGIRECVQGSALGGWNNILPRPLDDGYFLL